MRDPATLTRPRPGTARTVLVVDDSRAIRQIILGMLRGQGLFDVYLEARDGREGLDVAASHDVDLILCDLDMPVLDGFGFLRQFRADLRRRTVPVLMLSSTDQSLKKIQGLEHGANDYIVKPCDPAELCARVRNYLRLKLLSDELEVKNRELEAKNRELEQMAVTDPLTGLHNRRHFMTRATDELRRAQRSGQVLGLVMVDIDHFKRINDTLGHQQGDAVLCAVAGALRATARETDVLARFGGEEFVVALPGTDLGGALGLAERLRHGVQVSPIAGLAAPPTISLGLCCADAAGPGSIEGMIRLADAALYRAKANGRNRVEVAPAERVRAAA